MLYSIQSIQLIPSKISEIVEDELILFFSGQNTADETTNYIQNRVQLFLNENN